MKSRRNHHIFPWVFHPAFNAERSVWRQGADVFQVDVGLFCLYRGALQVLPYAKRGPVETGGWMAMVLVWL